LSGEEKRRKYDEEVSLTIVAVADLFGAPTELSACIPSWEFEVMQCIQNPMRSYPALPKEKRKGETYHQYARE
jgi:hypothetical protein